MRDHNPDPALLRELLRYEPETGKLFWRTREPRHFKLSATRSAEHICALWNVRYANTEAFTHRNRLGYCYGTLLGDHHRAHRVIAAMMLDHWPPEVDHDNGIRDDNRWTNLKAMPDRRTQMKNQMLPRRNKSGVMGVHQEGRSGRWVVTIGGKYVASTADFEKAKAIRQRAEIEHGYHPNHGRR